ncbi:MAG TPA: cyclopropane-fatty-acyl-phospholipid synthase family protein [Sphingomonadales bacterium]|nr:cyclopropane-fatty-acyl-phospholipid synthase family protein [Sphingomonadales bacterium]
MGGHAERAAERLRKAGALVSSGGALARFFYSAGPDQFVRLFKGRIGEGSLEISFPNGERRRLSGKVAGPMAVIEVHRWRALKRLIVGGSTSFARAYIEGDWTTPDLVAVVEFVARNRKGLNRNLRGVGWVKALNKLQHRLRANSPAGSRKNIRFHYDLGNDFYSAWLDPSMTYSCAVFETGDNSLEAAQRRKYEKLIELLEPARGQSILEIGCGWGGFAEVAASGYGTKVTGITLSKEQLNYAKGRIARAGLSEQVKLRLQDYRDVREKFDHVVSIEMFEAVGEEYWSVYFSKIREALKPGGRAALQIITIADELFEIYRKDVDFIQTYIFPGGMLPSIAALKREVAKAGLVWGKARMFGENYARTLSEWRRRFETAFREGKLPEGFDETFRRIWTYYLSYCEGGFRGGSINVMQLQLVKP